VASKLHGVEVDIKIIKRKGDPIDPEPSNRNVARAPPKESPKCKLSSDNGWKIDSKCRVERGFFVVASVPRQQQARMSLAPQKEQINYEIRVCF
jgi:hypothetical protein